MNAPWRIFFTSLFLGVLASSCALYRGQDLDTNMVSSVEYLMFFGGTADQPVVGLSKVHPHFYKEDRHPFPHFLRECEHRVQKVAAVLFAQNYDATIKSLAQVSVKPPNDSSGFSLLSVLLQEIEKRTKRVSGIDILPHGTTVLNPHSETPFEDNNIVLSIRTETAGDKARFSAFTQSVMRRLIETGHSPELKDRGPVHELALDDMTDLWWHSLLKDPSLGVKDVRIHPSWTFCSIRVKHSSAFKDWLRVWAGLGIGGYPQ